MITDWIPYLIGLIPFSLLAWLITHPEVAEKWGSIFYRCFSSISQRAERRHVALDIQGTINSFAKTINSELNGALPYGLKIHWVKETTREAFIKEGEAVVRMKHHGNQSKNLVYATMLYVSACLIPQARNCIDKLIMQAADLTMVKKVLIREKRFDALQFFNEEMLEPDVSRERKIRSILTIMARLDDLGLYTRILLREFLHVGLKSYQRMDVTDTVKETTQFFQLMERVANKKPDEDVSPDFISRNIRMSIVLIARPEVYLSSGIEPHISWIRKCLQKGIDTIYVLAMGDINIQAAKTLAWRVKEDKLLECLMKEEHTITDQAGHQKAIFLFLKRT